MTQSQLSWLLYGLPVVLIYIYYLRGRRRSSTTSSEQLQAAVAEGLAEPASLHPVVDLRRCIGSGACAKSCPEGALGVIDGKGVLINGAACIGHGACFDACPTNAIQLVFGTERRGVDIPVVKANFESNIPGLYIAGELGGMGLIRKAAEQGKQAIESIRQVEGSGFDLDVLIVGSGPAGIGAGLAAIQHKLRYRLIEQEDSLGGAVYHYPRNKIAMTAPVNLPLIGKVKFTEVSKEKLLAFWQDVVGRTGLRISVRERMERIERSGEGFVVHTSSGSHRARCVLLAIGRRGTPRKLDVPGEEQAKVVYRLVDPDQYSGQRVLVVGGGDSALEAAIALAGSKATQVTLSYRGEAFNRVKAKNRQRVQSLQEKRRLMVLLQSQVLSIGTDDVTIRTNAETMTLRNDAVVVCAGGVLPTGLLQEIGVQFETKHGEA